MPILGLRHTGNFEANERPKNWREGILRQQPNGDAPLFALTALMGERTTDDPEFSWFEKLMPSRRGELSANLAIDATSLAVASGAKTYPRGTILRSEQTEELFYVTADPPTDTAIPVSRGFAGSTAATVTIASENPFFHIVGNAYEEGSDAPTGVNWEPTRKRNYTQIFRNTLEMTRTARKTRLRTGDQVKEAKRECMEEHARAIEMAMFFGKPYEGSMNGKPFRTTGGVISFIDPANIVDVSGGNVTTDLLDDWMQAIFAWGSNEKTAFIGSTALAAINRAVKKDSHYNISAGVKEYGMNVTRITSPFGELVVKTHPLFRFHTQPSAGRATLDTWLFVLDQKEIEYVCFSGDDMRYEQKLNQVGVDGDKSGFITECGLEVNFPKSHFLIRGMKTGVASS